MRQAIRALQLGAAVAVLIAGAVWWPRLIGFVDFVFVVLVPLVLALGYRFDDGSPRYAELTSTRPIRRSSVALIIAVVVSWTDVWWCFGAGAAIAVIQLFQRPRWQPLALAMAAAIVLVGALSTDGPIELVAERRESTGAVGPVLACTTATLLLLAALVQRRIAAAVPGAAAQE